MIITIDGPAASGKSSVARKLAHDLGFFYLNTGFLYRAAAYLLINKGHCLAENFDQLTHDFLADFFKRFIISYTYDPINKELLLFDGICLNSLLKTAEIDRAASLVSKNEHVRHLITLMQRSIASNHDLIIDGRDCGTVVFPYANLKIFLTASLDIRALRWKADQLRAGKEYTFDQSLDAVKKRDESDTTRQHGPLRVPENAVYIDNSGLTFSQTIDIIRSHLSN